MTIGLQIVREDFVLYVAGGYEKGKFSDGNDRVMYVCMYVCHLFSVNLLQDMEMVMLLIIRNTAT